MNGNKTPYNLECTVPVNITEQERVELTCSCPDAEIIPKVEFAGKQIVENGQKIQIMHNGLKVVAGGYYGDWMAEIIERCKGHHEPQEELAFYEVLKRIPVQAKMLEVGGFWVYYSLWFLKEFPTQRQAFAIEPDPAHIKVGEANATLNGLPVKFIQGFISKETGVQNFQTEKSGVLSIPAISIVDFIKQQNIDYLDLILCDAQGGEIALLEGLQALVEHNKIGFVIVSTHSEHITGDPLTHQRCLAIIKSLNGQVLLEHDVHESFSGDGLIVAKFGEKIVDWVEPKLSRSRYSASFFRNPLYDLAVARGENKNLHHQIVSLEQKLKDKLTQCERAEQALHDLLTQGSGLRARLKKLFAKGS
jgi:FkbM family methyltransferase